MSITKVGTVAEFEVSYDAKPYRDDEIIIVYNDEGTDMYMSRATALELARLLELAAGQAWEAKK